MNIQGLIKNSHKTQTLDIDLIPWRWADWQSMKQIFHIRVSALRLHLRVVPSSHVPQNWVRSSFQEKHTQLEYKSKSKMSEFSWCSRNTRPLSLNTVSAVPPSFSEAHKEIPYVKQDLLQTLYMIKFLLSFRQGKINLTLKQSKC